MLIDNTKINCFIETSIQQLRLNHTETVTFPCPRCGTGVYFPVIARQHDLDAFKELLKIATTYLIDEGILEKMLTSITDRINLSLLINKAIKGDFNA
jgi:predicted RNA-binding Zn-ribbon protein involved in translation (DUF1610 family)